MRLPELRRQVAEANRAIAQLGLARFTFGNASGRADGLVAIKPSGVPYAALTPEDVVLVDLATGAVVEGRLRPSSDTPTHLVLYRAFPALGGVVHTHSTHATAWCQAGRALPCLGTTHADHCLGPVPVTAPLTDAQVAGAYEHETGVQIVAALDGRDPLAVPMVLVHGHAPFTWGRDVEAAVHHADVLEELARMAALTVAIHPLAPPIGDAVRHRHWSRKHGPTATYGQAT
jgi:L-ribulose-5-phosphate 4-epimerase